MEDVQTALTEQLADTLQTMLEAELDHEFGYDKHDLKNKLTANSRNGKSKKTIVSEFEPVSVKKRQSNVTGIEDQTISMYAKGVSTQDIQGHLAQLYGINVSATMISNVTSKILPLVKQWQSSSLQNVYAVVFIDAIHFKIKQDGAILNKVAYIVIGIDLDGNKDVLVCGLENMNP